MSPFADYPQFAAHVLGPSQCVYKSTFVGFISPKANQIPFQVVGGITRNSYYCAAGSTASNCFFQKEKKLP